MEQYLTTKELSNKIKMAQGTIRNLVWQNELKLNVHYVKPTTRKILFIWSGIEQWLYGGLIPQSHEHKTASQKKTGLINI